MLLCSVICQKWEDFSRQVVLGLLTRIVADWTTELSVLFFKMVHCFLVPAEGKVFLKSMSDPC